MSQDIDINFVGGSYSGRSIAVDGQETINFYPEIIDNPLGNSKTKIALYPTPGLSLYCTVSSAGGCRALFPTSGGRLFAVVGATFYEILTGNTYTSRGTLGTSSGFISITENETQLIIVDGSQGWIYTLASDALTLITDEDFPACTHVVNIDGYFVVNKVNKGEFYWSASRDGISWDALDFAIAEGIPDNIVAIGKINNELWVFGNNSAEIWYDTGNSESLFERINQGFIDIGCGAAFSVATIANNIIWLGGGTQGHGMVFSATGYVPQRISTHAIEYIIGQMTTTSDAVAYTYQHEGHFFYVLTFPTENRTLVYDLKTQMWHERGEWDTDTGEFNRHKSSCYAYWNGRNYVGDFESGIIYTLDADVYTDNGAVIRRERTGPAVRYNGARLFFHKFELDIERGVGLTTGQGSAPVMMLSQSDDGGKTWSIDRELSLGALGKYQTRAIANRLGSSRDRVFRVAISDPVKCVITGARVNVEPEAGTEIEQ
jgi:hypothetical protein